MTKPNPHDIGERFERASRELFKRILPRLGYEVVGEPRKQKGSGQYGYDLEFYLPAPKTVPFFNDVSQLDFLS